jgi:hypothetical protein
MPAPKSLTDAKLRAKWKDAKTAAAKKAKEKKQEALYKGLDEKSTEDFGPLLDKWAKAWPDLGKMGQQKSVILQKSKNYKAYVAKAKKAGLHDDVAKLLKNALDYIDTRLDELMDEAVVALNEDEDLALKQAIKASKKTVKPIVVFKHPDLSKIVMSKAPDAAQVVPIESPMPIEIVLADSKALNSLDDKDGNAAEKIKNAADFKTLVKDIIAAYRNAAKMLAKNPDEHARANSKFNADVDSAVEAAVGRAAVEVNKICEVRTSYRNYRIKSGVKLGVTILGTAAGGASLALAPFTGPAMVISAIGVMRGAASIGDQIADLSASAEDLIREVQGDVKKLQTRYETWSKNQVGAAESGTTALNAFLPTVVNTIDRCKSHCDTILDKINGIDTKADKMSIKLNDTLDAQTKAKKAIEAWQKKHKDEINAKLDKEITKLLTGLKANEKKVAKLIGDVTTLNERVVKATADQKKLAGFIADLKSKQATWSKVANVGIEAASGVTFLVAANVGWPDAYNIATTAKAITDMTGNVVGTLTELESDASNVRDLVEEVKRAA